MCVGQIWFVSSWVIRRSILLVSFNITSWYHSENRVQYLADIPSTFEWIYDNDVTFINVSFYEINLSLVRKFQN